MNERRQRWALVGLTLLAYLIRVVRLSYQSLWRDEVDAIRFASRPLSELLSTFLRPGENGPLYYLLLRPWLGFAGRSEFALRFFSVFFGVLSVLLLYRVARRVFPEVPWVGLLAGLFVATSPYLVWYSQDGKMYSIVVFAVLLSMDRFLCALQKGGWHRWLTYALVTGVAFYLHLLTVLIVLAQVLIFFVLKGEGRRLTWKAWLASLGVIAVVYLPMFMWQLPLLLQPAYVGYEFVSLPKMLSSLLANYSLGVVQQPSWWRATPAVVLLVAGVVLGIRESRVASVVLAGCWLIIPVAALFLITLSRPMYTPRYLVFVLPALLMLMSLGAVAIGRKAQLPGVLIVAAVLAVNGLGLWVQFRTPLKADFRAASGYVIRRLSPADLVVFQIPHGRHSFDYYYERSAEAYVTRTAEAPRPRDYGHRVYIPFATKVGAATYRYAEGLYTNAGMGSVEVDLRMAEMLSGSRVVWLVESEAAMWDERGLVKAWLDETGRLTDRMDFVSVTVYRYEAPLQK